MRLLRLQTILRQSAGTRLQSSYSLPPAKTQAVVLGIRETSPDSFELTPAAEKVASQSVAHLVEAIKGSGPLLKEGQSRILTSSCLGIESQVVVLVGLGNKEKAASKSEAENHDCVREGVRTAISAGVRTLEGWKDVKEVLIDDCGDAEAAAEGACLATWSFDQLKAKKNTLKHVALKPILDQSDAWLSGLKKAQGQNLSRTLMETPANLMTPSIFAQTAMKELEPLGVEVIARDEQWMREKKMGSYLSVTRGSAEKPVFLEMHYNGQAAKNKAVLVGKGVTFDSGGISLKPSKGMDAMRADMGGAACVVGTMKTIASLRLPLSVTALTPLCENMPGSKATKPGDVVYAMNGKSIQIDNTDAEGRLILADALCYAGHFKPLVMMDVATLTGAMSVALGGATAGVFTNSNRFWPLLEAAAFHSGDRVWRMPLWQHYSKLIQKCDLADLNNISGSPGGGACTAAAFLKEFVSCENWFHLDIAGVMDNKDEVAYLPKGMAGRPTRTMSEFLVRVNGLIA